MKTIYYDRTDRNLTRFYKAPKRLIKLWTILLVFLGTLHCQYTDPTIEVNYFMYPIGAFILLSPVLVVQLSKHGYLPIKWLVYLVSLYFIGVLSLCFIRQHIFSELPRAMMMAMFVWGGLVCGTCIGSSDELIKVFYKTFLILGVGLVLFTIGTKYGVVIAPAEFVFNRNNRFYSTIFSVTDPTQIFAVTLWLFIRDRAKVFLPILFLIPILIILTVVRQSYIIFGLVLITYWLCRFHRFYRVLLAAGLLIIVLIAASFVWQASQRSELPLLKNINLVDVNGQLIEDPRVKLTGLLLNLAAEAPLTGIGMDAAKNCAWFEATSSARTEHGYVVHLAAFGFIVPLPFFLVMLIGGLFMPLYSLIKLPSKLLVSNSPLYGLAIGLTLSGFVGNFGTATSVSGYFSLVQIGILIGVCSRSWQQMKQQKQL
jgi:hypothetical protein